MFSRRRLKREAHHLGEEARRHSSRAVAAYRPLKADAEERLRSPFAVGGAFALGLVAHRLHPMLVVAVAARVLARGMAVMRLMRLAQRALS